MAQQAECNTGAATNVAPSFRNENEIIKAHDARIRAFAAKFAQTSSADRKDLEQVGRIALVKAARRWEAERAQLWTFAHASVCGAMLRHATRGLDIAGEELGASTLAGDGDACGDQGRPFDELVGAIALDGCGSTEPDQEQGAELAELMARLTADERETIRMSLEGYGLVEIAAAMTDAGNAKSKSEVWRIYRRAVTKMQRSLVGDK